MELFRYYEMLIWIRKEIKSIIIEALHEWESQVEYLGREGYKWEDNKWVKLETPDEVSESTQK